MHDRITRVAEARKQQDISSIHERITKLVEVWQQDIMRFLKAEGQHRHNGYLVYLYALKNN
jgi:hypothetical protein